MNSIKKNQNGGILILVLVFISLFVVVAGGLVSLAVSQNKLGNKKLYNERALEIAEAGINYYRWHLAHDPTDFRDGTELPGPYVHNYNDPYGSKIGEFSLQITPPNDCSTIVTIASTGNTVEEPNVTRKIVAQYGKPTLANFAFLTNSNVWFGITENINGSTHSNGGIRMDGIHNGLVTSARETYICGSEHGCSSGGEIKPGIWGSGGNSNLWNFPVTEINFNLLTADLVTLKDMAQTSGIYIPQQGLGYHVNFLADGSFDLYRVTQLENPVWGYDGVEWKKESWDIRTESFIQNYALPSNCSVVFVEDNVWVDGIINGLVTLVAGKLPDISDDNRNIIINGNITYANSDGLNVLGIIAQKDILIPLYSAPDNLEINAALLAQKGHVFRNYYPNWYAPYHIRNQIILTGVIITNTLWTWSWVNSSNIIISGYDNTITNYDQNLKFNAPPGYPTQGDFDIVRWSEIN